MRQGRKQFLRHGVTISMTLDENNNGMGELFPSIFCFLLSSNDRMIFNLIIQFSIHK